MGLDSAVGIAFSDLAVRWGFDYSIAGVSFVHPDVECSGMNTDVSVWRCVMGVWIGHTCRFICGQLYLPSTGIAFAIAQGDLRTVVGRSRERPCYQKQYRC